MSKLPNESDQAVDDGLTVKNAVKDTSSKGILENPYAKKKPSKTTVGKTERVLIGSASASHAGGLPLKRVGQGRIP